jgi:hypothetical protein
MLYCRFVSLTLHYSALSADNVVTKFKSGNSKYKTDLLIALFVSYRKLNLVIFPLLLSITVGSS